MKKITTVVLLTVLALIGIQASAKEWTKVRIGVEGAYPPFSFVDAEGNIKGFDIDIALALCKEMEVECKLVQSDWDGLIPGLLARKFDAIIASMSITEDRKRKVTFTNKYYRTPAKFVRRKDSGIAISPQSLQGKTVGVQRATVHDSFLTDNYAGIVNIKRYGTQNEAYLDMTAGRLDLLLADLVVLQDEFLKTEAGQNFEFVGPNLTDQRWFGEGIGIALRKGDDDLRERLNQAIAAIRANGAYQQIQDKYFDFDVYGE